MKQPQAAGGAVNPNANTSLFENINLQCESNQLRQIERLKTRYNPVNPGGAEVRGFK